MLKNRQKKLKENELLMKNIKNGYAKHLNEKQSKKKRLV